MMKGFLTVKNIAIGVVIIILFLFLSGNLQIPGSLFAGEDVGLVTSYAPVIDAGVSVWCGNILSSGQGVMAVMNIPTVEYLGEPFIEPGSYAIITYPDGTTQQVDIQFSRKDCGAYNYFDQACRDGDFDPHWVALFAPVSYNNYEGWCSIDYHIIFDDTAVCIPNWQCGEFTTCVDGTQSRTCFDGCGNTVTENKGCVPAPPPFNLLDWIQGLLDDIANFINSLFGI